MILQTLKREFFFRMLERSRFGRIELVVGDAQPRVFGDGAFVSRVRLTDESVLAKILSRGDIGLAEGIIAGEIEISDQAGFVEWACRNDDLLRGAIHGTWMGVLLPRLQRLLQPNSLRGAKKNIMAHYDLGNEFYGQWLDSTMTYSSAIFSRGVEPVSANLTTAQLAKYDRIIDQLGITERDHVLEVGCGWGGFFSRAVERTGCRVTAVMNSPAQADYNQRLIAERGMTKNVDLRLIDYRQISGKFSKIVSIEMIEAVGEPYWNTYFSKIANSLEAGGQALIQAITMREDRFDEYRNSTDFIKKFIFPGGMLLSNGTIEHQARAVGMKFDDQPFEFGISYAETLKLWREAFHGVKGRLDQYGLDDRFMRLWDFYFGYCEGAFRSQRINVGQFLLEA